MASDEVALLLRLGVRDSDASVREVIKWREGVVREVKTAAKEAEASARAQARAAQLLSDSRQRAAENVLGSLPAGRQALIAKELIDDLRTVRREAAEAGGVLNVLSNRFGSGAVAVGAMAGATTLLVASSAAAVGGLLALVKHAADAGSRFHDLSIETGLTVETLSGLELQLKQSGASAEDLGASVFELQKRLDDAAQGNKKLKATFADLGIKDTRAALSDTDGTLRKVLSSLSAIKDEGTRNAVGNEVLGRSYKQLRVFIAEAGGDIEKVIEKAKAAGLVMSSEAAAAADEFGDAMDELSLKADRFATQVGVKLIPELLKLFRVLTDESQNAGSIVSFVANSIGSQFRNATHQILLMIAAIKTAAELKVGDVVGAMNPFGSGNPLVEAFERNAAAAFGAAYKTPPKGNWGTDETAGFTRSGGGGGGGGGGKSGMSAEDAAKRLREIELERVRAVSERTLEAERYLFDQRSISLREYTRRQLEEAQKVLNVRLDNLKAEEAEAGKLKGRERAVRLKEIEQETLEARLEFASKRSQAQDELDREEFESEKAHRDSLLRQREEEDARDLAQIEEHVERGNKTFKRAAEERADIERDAYRRRREELEAQLREAGENFEERQRIVDQLDELYEEESSAAEEAGRRIRKSVRDTLEAQREYYVSLERLHAQSQELLREASRIELERSGMEITSRRKYLRRLLELEREESAARHRENLRQIDAQQRADEEKLRRTGEYEARKLELERYYDDLRKAEGERRKAEQEREGQDEDALDPFQQMKDALGKPVDFAEFGLDSILEGLQAMKGALREGVAAWLLYGDSIGKAMKQALAAHLAKVAAEAAIQAILHAAYAIGNLAFGNFAAAALHAKAAAMFGGVALAAGVGARALAKSSGLYGGEGGGGGGNAGGETPYETERMRREREQAEADRHTRREERGQPLVIQSNLYMDGTQVGQVMRQVYITSGGGFRETVLDDVDKSRGI